MDKKMEKNEGRNRNLKEINHTHPREHQGVRKATIMPASLCTWRQNTQNTCTRTMRLLYFSSVDRLARSTLLAQKIHTQARQAEIKHDDRPAGLARLF